MLCYGDMIELGPPRATKTLMTDCFSLDLYMVPDNAILAKGEHSTVITRPSDLACLYISADDPYSDKIMVRVCHGRTELTQAIELTRTAITFGLRRYFLCSCGRRVNSLYLKHGHFACRHCHNLAYEITRLRVGTFAYKINRHDKIEDAKHQVRNISYGSVGYTRKARQVLSLVSKYC